MHSFALSFFPGLFLVLPRLFPPCLILFLSKCVTIRIQPHTFSPFNWVLCVSEIPQDRSQTKWVNQIHHISLNTFPALKEYISPTCMCLSLCKERQKGWYVISLTVWQLLSCAKIMRILCMCFSAACGGKVELHSERRGVIYSPSWPLNYPPGVNCSWNIQGNRGDVITIR